VDGKVADIAVSDNEKRASSGTVAESRTSLPYRWAAYAESSVY